MAALGEEFRSAREARGLSLSDVAERLHIRSVYLSAIEDEDWKAIGAPVYVRGFMRTYARFLGLDAEDAVARFSAAAPAGIPVATATARGDERVRDASAERRAPSLIAILAIVAAVAVVAYVGYAYVQYKAAPPVAVASTEPTGSPAPEPSAEGTPATVPAAPHPKRVANRGLHLHLTQASWLRVAIDGRVVAEGTFPAGTTKSFAGKSADVRVGNAGGVTIAVNGRAIAPLGASGDVAEKQFALSGE